MSSDCANLDEGQSSTWQGSPGDPYSPFTFSWRLAVADWAGTNAIQIKWSQRVNLQSVFGADLVAGAQAEVTMLSLGPMAPSQNMIQLIGVTMPDPKRGAPVFATKDVIFKCLSINAPPPSPPFLLPECDMDVTYAVLGSWPNAVRAELRIAKWTGNRIVTVTYWDAPSTIGLQNINRALLVKSSINDYGNKAFQLKLIPQAGMDSRSEDTVFGTLDFEVHPPVRSAPKITCHDPWSPPPPPPPPLPPSPPPPPSPAPPFIAPKLPPQPPLPLNPPPPPHPRPPRHSPSPRRPEPPDFALESEEEEDPELAAAAVKSLPLTVSSPPPPPSPPAGMLDFVDALPPEYQAVGGGVLGAAVLVALYSFCTRSPARGYRRREARVHDNPSSARKTSRYGAIADDDYSEEEANMPEPERAKPKPRPKSRQRQKGGDAPDARDVLRTFAEQTQRSAFEPQTAEWSGYGQVIEPGEIVD
jgi:hypothetical protein